MEVRFQMAEKKRQVAYRIDIETQKEWLAVCETQQMVLMEREVVRKEWMAAWDE